MKRWSADNSGNLIEHTKDGPRVMFRSTGPWGAELAFRIAKLLNKDEDADE